MRYLLIVLVSALLLLGWKAMPIKAQANDPSTAKTTLTVEIGGEIVTLFQRMDARIQDLETKVQELEKEVAELQQQPAETVETHCDVSQEEELTEEEEEVAVEEEETVLPLNYAASDVLISEFVADPEQGEKEWIELYNNSAETIDLQDWVLEEGAGKQTRLSGLVAASEYFVVEKANLNNSGDMILLKDPTEKVIDQVTYGNWDDGNVEDNAPNAKKSESVMREQIAQDLNLDNLDFKVTTKITKGYVNELVVLMEIVEEIVETPVVVPVVEENLVVEEEPVVEEETVETQNFASLPDFSEKIQISEILPNPEGADADGEWIEIHNFDEQPLNLYKWQVADDKDIYEIAEDLIVPAFGYIILPRETTGLVLTNKKDVVKLIDPNGKQISSVDYENAKSGRAYAIFGGEWQWTKELTPAAENKIEESDEG